MEAFILFVSILLIPLAIVFAFSRKKKLPQTSVPVELSHGPTLPELGHYFTTLHQTLKRQRNSGTIIFIPFHLSVKHS